MKLPLPPDIHTLLKFILEQGDYYGNFENVMETIYITYAQLSDELGNEEKEVLEVFEELSFGEDDLANLFKVIALYDREVDEEFNYHHGDVPKMLMKSYMETSSESNCLVIDSLFKFKEVVPSWIFKYSLFTFEVIHQLSLNDFLETFLLFLIHHEKRNWSDESLCPTWGGSEQSMFERFMIELERRLLDDSIRIHPLKQIDKFELFKLMYEHCTNLDCYPEAVSYFGDYYHKLVTLELEKLKYMERNESRSKRMIGILSFMRYIKFKLKPKMFIPDLFSIIGDATETLEIRKSAMLLVTFCELPGGIESLALCLKCCRSDIPQPIIQNAFNKSLTIRMASITAELTVEDCNVLKDSMMMAAYNFQVESTNDVLSLFIFIITYKDYLADIDLDYSLSIILNKATKYIHELENTNYLEEIIEFIRERGFSYLSAIVLPGYFDAIKKRKENSIPLVTQLALCQSSIKLLLEDTVSHSRREILEQLSSDLIPFIYDYYKPRVYLPADMLAEIIIANRIYHEFPPLVDSTSNIYLLLETCCDHPSQNRWNLSCLLAECLRLGLPIPKKVCDAINGLETDTHIMYLIMVGIFYFIDIDISDNLFAKYLKKLGGEVDFFLSPVINDKQVQKVYLLGFLLFMDDYLERNVILYITSMQIDIQNDDGDLSLNSFIYSLHEKVKNKYEAIL